MGLPSRSTRVVAASAAAVLALAGLTLTVSGGSATAADSVFAPRLVTVDTPTRADKKRLQRLGLDLTEHAGHDYVEVVLHNGVDLNRLLGSGLRYDVRIADLNKREAAEQQGERGVRRSDGGLPAAVRPRQLPHPRQLQRRHAHPRVHPPGHREADRTAEEVARRTHRLRDRDRSRRPGGRGWPACVRAPRRAPRPGMALGRARDGVRARPREELRVEPADHRPAQQARAWSSYRWSTWTASSSPAPTAGSSTCGRPTTAGPARSSAPPATPTSARTAGSSTARTPPTAPAGSAARPAPVDTAPVST